MKRKPGSAVPLDRSAQDTRAYDAALALGQRPWADVERDARATAIRFGVDPNLPPRERCMAVARKIGMTSVLRAATKGAIDREPGQDDEEVAA